MKEPHHEVCQHTEQTSLGRSRIFFFRQVFNIQTSLFPSSTHQPPQSVFPEKQPRNVNWQPKVNIHRMFYSRRFLHYFWDGRHILNDSKCNMPNNAGDLPPVPFMGRAITTTTYKYKIEQQEFPTNSLLSTDRVEENCHTP